MSVFLPGWADESSKLPHPAPLVNSLETSLASLLGLGIEDFSTIPGAVCRWQGNRLPSTQCNVPHSLAQNENADAPSDHQPFPPKTLVCADPVHLMAGSDDAQLIPAARLTLSLEESQQLISELNEALGEEESTFLLDERGFWYYQGLDASALNTAPTTAVEGHPMTGALPRSNDARAWRSLWSEVQMVLHQSSVNQERQSRGEAAINSVWFWGGGAMPYKKTAQGVVVYSDDPFAIGLAQSLGAQSQPLNMVGSVDLSNINVKHHVVVDTQLMRGNPDFIDQRDIGVAWGERIQLQLSKAPKASAELIGLTGCTEIFAPSLTKTALLQQRIAQLFKR